MNKAEIRKIAKQALDAGNQYIKDSIEYAVDGKPMFIYKDGKAYSRQELDNAYFETACKDIKIGYNDRRVGYYDKWCRYNRADGGRAYDLGVKLALLDKNTPAEMQIIPCQ